MQQLLRANREKAEKAFSAALNLGKEAVSSADAVAAAAAAAGDAGTKSAVSPETAMDVDGMDNDESQALQAALKLSLEGKADSRSVPVVGPGLPADFTGLYELHSVVTHKGRSADSGHYMGYVRQGPSSNQWWCFNDEKVLSDVTTEDILLLCGGGDRDIAYLTFYKYKSHRK